MENTREYFGVAGKNALVTGGARGIGRAICEVLADCGATVVVSDRDEAGCNEVVAALKARGATAHALPMDIGSEEAILDGFARASRLLSGQLDILVNNAGMMAAATLFEDRLDLWDKMYAVNIRGTFVCSREGARMMRAAGKGGRIINISSSAAVRPVLDGVAPYAASKGGINAFSQSLAWELAPDAITVNTIMPHGIMHANAATQYEENDAMAKGGEALSQSRYRMPRTGEPKDIAMLTAFLAGPGGGFITGQNIAVDGGYLVT